MFIPTNNFDYWKLLNIQDITFNGNGIDLSKCSVKKIGKKINYEEAIKYIIDLQNNINIMESNHLSFYTICKEDFLIINDNLYIISNNIKKLNNNYFTIKEKINPPKFVPPEFKYEIPLTLYKSFCYFQICSIIKDILIIPLENIKHTPLYYCISRGLVQDPLKRFLIII